MSELSHGFEEQFHGGIDHDELRKHGKSLEQILDLSSNILSVRHPQKVLDAIHHASLSSYPDRECTELRQAIADKHLVDRDRILLGNGCSELIYLVANAYLRQCDQKRVLVYEPTFSEYRRASELAGAEVETCFVDPLDAAFDWYSDCSERLNGGSFDLFWICNPNNPTGKTIERDEIERLARSHPKTLFVVDESYMEFAKANESVASTQRSNVVCLRSLTKSHALAGIRLGYVIAADEIIELLQSHRIPWSVNAVAQSTGLAVLESQSCYDQAIEQMRRSRQRLHQELLQRDFHPIESDANFLLIPVEDATAFRDRMLQDDVLVRDCRSFGLERYVRISVGSDLEIDRLLAAIDGRNTTRDLTNVVGQCGSPQNEWTAEFRGQLNKLFRLRRDVRRFRTDAIPIGCIQRWIDAACLAPSVGLSEPWRFVSVNDPKTRLEVSKEFKAQNALAADGYDHDEKDRYLRLKLAGIQEAPEQLAVFVVPSPEQGKGLGRQTMPETVEYSVVAAIQNFWLAARAEGVGVGWVSILRDDRVNEILNVPKDWQLIAYLCIGYPVDSMSDVPSLQTEGWEKRSKREQVWTTA